MIHLISFVFSNPSKCVKIFCKYSSLFMHLVIKKVVLYDEIYWSKADIKLIVKCLMKILCLLSLLLLHGLTSISMTKWIRCDTLYRYLSLNKIFFRKYLNFKKSIPKLISALVREKFYYLSYYLFIYFLIKKYIENNSKQRC